MGREGKLERLAEFLIFIFLFLFKKRLAEFGESQLLHKLEECAIRCLSICEFASYLLLLGLASGLVGLMWRWWSTETVPKAFYEGSFLIPSKRSFRKALTHNCY